MAAKTHKRCAWRGGWLAAFIALTGCQTVNEVTVDSITNSEKPLGVSYHLEVHDPSGGVDKDLYAQAIANVKEALATRGLFEAPPTTQPDMVVNVEYGVGPGEIKIINRANVDMLMGPYMRPEPNTKAILVFEKFIELTAREPVQPGNPPAKAGKPSRGEELWSVYVSVEDPKKELAPYLPVLASATIDYIGQNSGAEKHLVVKTEEAKAALRRKEPRPAAVH